MPSSASWLTLEWVMCCLWPDIDFTNICDSWHLFLDPSVPWPLLSSDSQHLFSPSSGHIGILWFSICQVKDPKELGALPSVTTLHCLSSTGPNASDLPRPWFLCEGKEHSFASRRYLTMVAFSLSQWRYPEMIHPTAHRIADNHQGIEYIIIALGLRSIWCCEPTDPQPTVGETNHLTDSRFFIFPKPSKCYLAWRNPSLCHEQRFYSVSRERGR